MNRIEKQYKPGQQVTVVNPRTGKVETGTITSYAYTTTNTIHNSRGTSGVMIRFPSNRHPVEIDGAFL
jgi:hypothetical protein